MIPASLPQILDEHGEGLLLEVHVSIPALVQAFHADTQTVDVLPAVRMPHRSLDNIPVVEELPVINDVPLVQTSGAGFIVACPVAPNDSVILLFSEQSYSEWRQTGKVSSPKDQRRHGIGYPFAIPGIRPDANKLTSAQTNKLVIGKDGSSEQFIIGSGQLDAGADNVGSVADGDALDNLFTMLSSATGTLDPGWIAFLTAFNTYISSFHPRTKTVLFKAK